MYGRGRLPKSGRWQFPATKCSSARGQWFPAGEGNATNALAACSTKSAAACSAQGVTRHGRREQLLWLIIHFPKNFTNFGPTINNWLCFTFSDLPSALHKFCRLNLPRRNSVGQRCKFPGIQMEWEKEREWAWERLFYELKKRRVKIRIQLINYNKYEYKDK